MAASPYARNLLLNFLLRNVVGTAPSAWYVALFTGNPEESEDNEVSASGYARVSVTFAAPLGGSLKNSSTIAFSTATTDWGTVSHFGIYDALTVGNLLAYGSFESGTEVVVDDEPTILAGDLEVVLE